jgi:hypothetical protein
MTDTILTESRKNILRGWGVPDSDFPQIEKATKSGNTRYTYIPKNGEERLISRDEAIRRLGVKGYLSGIERSAFHWTAYRDTKDGRGAVYFDSSRLFKR